ncbi:MAG: hypothetical protein AAFP70_05140 [Calditrichota bacterium]
MKKLETNYLQRISLICGLLLMLSVQQLQAGLFDDRYPSARAMGMGGSGVADAHGVWSSYYNPAGLSRQENLQIGTAYMRLFNLEYFRNFFGGGAAPINSRFGGVAVAFEYFGVDYQNQNLSGEYTFALSHGFHLLRDIHSSLSFGYSLKGYHYSLGTSVDGLELGSATTLGVDMGFQASVFGRTHIGLYVLNVNAPQIGEGSKEELSQRLMAGISYQPYDGVTTSIDFNRQLQSKETEVWAGAEFRVFNYVLLRFGGTSNPNRFSAGIGLDMQQITIDYGMRTHSELGESHLVGVSYSF